MLPIARSGMKLGARRGSAGFIILDSPPCMCQAKEGQTANLATRTVDLIVGVGSKRRVTDAVGPEAGRPAHQPLIVPRIDQVRGTGRVALYLSSQRALTRLSA